MNRWLSDAALDRLRAAADTPDLEGTRYRLVQKLGQGGMGGVFCVEDVTLGRQVALKALNLPDVERVWFARLLQEARVIAKLEHPGIVPVYQVDRLPAPDGRPFYTMKLVKGETLGELLKRRKTPAEDLLTFLGYFRRVCEALAFAHARKVIHRDLKAANVIITMSGRPKVLDFGLSRRLEAGSGSDETTVLEASWESQRTFTTSAPRK